MDFTPTGTTKTKEDRYYLVINILYNIFTLLLKQRLTSMIDEFDHYCAFGNNTFPRLETPVVKENCHLDPVIHGEFISKCLAIFSKGKIVKNLVKHPGFQANTRFYCNIVRTTDISDLLITMLIKQYNKIVKFYIRCITAIESDFRLMMQYATRTMYQSEKMLRQLSIDIDKFSYKINIELRARRMLMILTMRYLRQTNESYFSLTPRDLIVYYLTPMINTV